VEHHLNWVQWQAVLIGKNNHTDKYKNGARMFDEVAIRIARPCADLAAAERFYVQGLGMEVLWRATATAPEEHDLVMVGWARATWHLELVGGPNLVVAPTPTAEDLLVLYLGEPADEALLARIEQAGGTRVPQGPYWDRWGVTVRDPDGYRLVLSTRQWSNAELAAHPVQEPRGTTRPVS
jgi:catechol 2,3-dioxygenase-like lactoylglutathione lyase family enzyme